MAGFILFFFVAVPLVSDVVSSNREKPSLLREAILYTTLTVKWFQSLWLNIILAMNHSRIEDSQNEDTSTRNFCRDHVSKKP